MAKNKVKYGLKNVHIAKCTVVTDETTGETTYTYDTPKAMPGAVNLSLEAEGDTSPFYADNMVYFRASQNNGCSGDLEIALVPDWFRTEILNERLDVNGTLIESSEIQVATPFAMLFEFEGDVKKIRHVLYFCTVSNRPSVASQTREDSITPVTETLEISADPRADGLVKARSGDNTLTSTYNAWYNTVYIPASGDFVPTYAYLTGLTIGSLTLSPTFDASTTVYTASTSNASDLVTATASTGVGIAVVVNGSTITNGTAPEWRSGANTVKVITSGTDLTSLTYTVTVTYTPAG